MPARTDSFDLGALGLSSGEARRLDLGVGLGTFDFGRRAYGAEPESVPLTLDVSRMTGGGYSLRVRFGAALGGPCMRCLGDAAPSVVVDAREVDQPGGGDELTSPYVDGEVLDLGAWAHDAFALAMPAQVLCRDECAGLCPSAGRT